MKTANSWWRAGSWVALAVICAGAPARAQDNDFCLDCHAQDPTLTAKRGERTVSLYVDPEKFGASVHSGVECVTCHTDLEKTELPHKLGVKPVDCAQCHEKEQEVYAESLHGQRLAANDPLAPRCQDCHGNHYIVPVADRHSATSPFNVPQMCAQCHAEGAPVERAYDIPQDKILERYKESIHGEGLFKQGLVVTAVCTSCHTGHSVLPHTDPRSTISKENVSGTCMKCHGMIEVVHRKIVRGALWEKEPNKIPNCVECHSPHEIRKATYDTGVANADCMTCHEKPGITAADGRDMYVKADEYGNSIHGRKMVGCAQCHSNVTPSLERPCATIKEKVDCAVCHEAAVADYNVSVHGTLAARSDPSAPGCLDCHGKHGMLEHRPEPASPDMVKLRVREGPTFVTNVPSLCGRCHGEGGQADVRYLGTQKNIVANYLQSVHGKGLLASGLTVTATCTSCHTAHRALPANDPRSSVHVTNTPSTCGNCHHGIYEQFVGSIHSPLKNTDYKQLKGQPPLPGCNDCHPPHSVIRTAEDEFRNGIIETCGKCHADVAETYFDTYHGKASRLEGGAKAAKCQDCHGAHDILPPMDLASHLSRTNIVDTCAKCHPGSNRQFAGYLTHATHHDPHKYPQLFYVFWGMTGLLVGTFGFFGLHTLIWLPRSWKLRRELAAQGIIASPHAPKQVVRFSSKVRRMHFVMILSFFGLALTGMMLKFSYMGWARFIARAVGGYAAAGFIHRVCAVVMVCLFIYHLWDARQGYKRSGKTLREFLFGANTILPQLRDLTEFVGTVKWFFGKGPRPQYGRWTYWEKFDYFAVFWGVAVIGSTGVFLWFPEFFTWLHVPGKLINVATIIHSDEALLATGFIFTIHFFNTNLRPEKFPMDLVMFTGRMPLDEFKHERPREHAELLSRGELDEKLAPAATPGFIRASRVFGAVALTVGMTLVLLIIYTMIWKYR